METKVMLVDDHLLLRDALAKLINEFERFSVIGVGSNGAEMMELLNKGTVPDIIVLDLNMPIMDGYKCVDWLNKEYPKVKVLILTMYDSEVPLLRLLREGVRGFLKKDIHPEDLRTALNSVAQNGYYYCNNSTGKLASFFQDKSPGTLGQKLLAPIEIEFLKLASTDMTYKEIAAGLKMSARTIDSYRDALFEKLDVKSRVGLAIYAIKNGIVQF